MVPSRRPLNRAAFGLLALGLCVVLLAPLIAPIGLVGALLTPQAAPEITYLPEPMQEAPVVLPPLAEASGTGQVEPTLPITFAPPLAPFATALEAALDAHWWAVGRGGMARTGFFGAVSVAPPYQPRWRITMPDGIFAAPLVVGATIYAAAGDGTLYALDQATGGLRWSYATDDWILATPALADGTLFVPSRSGVLAALDARTGQVQWTQVFAGELFAAPLLHNQHLFFGAGDGIVYALHTANGTQSWAMDLGSPIFTAPALADDLLYVGTVDGAVVALDAATGTIRWQVQTDGPVLSTPAFADATLYAASYDGNLYALDGATGAERWRFTAAGTISAPALHDGRVVIADTSGAVYALDATSGALIWQQQLDGRIYSTDLLAASIAGGLVYIGSEHGGDDAQDTAISGTLHTLSLADGSVLDRFPTAGGIRSSAAISDGTLYIGDIRGVLYALERVTGMR
jgi:outer membrane protein assembly factor BamB